MIGGAKITASVSGGEVLTSRLQQMAENAGEPKTLRVGFLEGATESVSGVSIPMIAAIHEFGAPRAGIPPRPFFRPMIKEKSPAWPKALAKILPTVDYDTDQALGMMGAGIQKQLQDSIRTLQLPALSPVTLMLRKMRIGKTNAPVTFAMVKEARRRVAAGESYGGVSTKPLVDSGEMLAAASYEIDDQTTGP